MVQTSIDDDCGDDQPANTLELFTEYDLVLKMIDELLPVSTETGFERKYEVYSEVLGRYQYQPHLLDPHLGELIQRILKFINTGSVATDPLSHAAFKYLYQIIKVRNYKILVNFLPHELTDLEFVLNALEKQDSNDTVNWETRYVLLLWMSILVLNPFHLSRLDALSQTQSPSGLTKIERIYQLCEHNTDNNDPCSSVAAYMTAKYMSRIDVSEKFLHKFFSNLATVHGSNADAIKVGQLAAIAQILKHGKRESLLREAPTLLQWIVSCDFKGNSDYLKYKFYIKTIQRLGMVFLKPRLARWRYQRGSRSLMSNLTQASHPEGLSELQSTDIKEDYDEDIELVDEIEDIIEELLQGLRSASSNVRWSSAKGIGRITNRLPKSLGDEVVGTVIDMMSPVEQHEAWHGACLAIAELAKRGLLLPYRLTAMVPLLLQALVYDELKGCMSVGQHIRDAACYMSWAFARAYNPQDLAAFVDQIASGLLITTVFDREINCRRAASAAFQESVGRLGNFPHGIDILTVADFFSVGVRTNAFLEISEFISQFDQYKLPLIDHLLQKKINHWDVTIRELTAKALNRLTKRSPQHVANVVMQKLFDLTDSIDVNTRHGSIVALGEVTLALKELEAADGGHKYLLPDSILLLNELVGKFFTRDQFRGMSGEIMKQGCSDFIQNCSKARIETSEECLEAWQSFIDKCLVNKNAQIREAAVRAFHAVCVSYYEREGASERNLEIIDNYLDGCRNDLEEHIRMGYLMAVGSFPRFFIELKLSAVVDTLIAQSRIPNAASNPHENVQTRTWSEARRDSVTALTSIMMKMDLGGMEVTETTRKCVAEVFECFLLGLEEYTSDNRGDIGAWVREASMKGLYQMLITCPKEMLSEELLLRIMRGFAQQAVEKIDRTRGLAGKLFSLLVHHGPVEIPYIKRHAELKEIFPKDIETVLWLFADNTFPLFCSMLAYEEYSQAVLLGLTSSIGQLSESLIKHSSNALFNFMKANPEHVPRLGNEILGVFRANLGNDRITSPMLNFIDLLIRSGSVNALIYEVNESGDAPSFGDEVFRLINLEIKGHKKMYKLVSAMNVLCQLIQVKSLVTKIFSKVSVFLGLPLVHVRKTTATKFYEALILYGDQTDIEEDNLESVFNLLTDTDWGQPLEQVRPIRNELCRLIGIKPPIAAAATAGN